MKKPDIAWEIREILKQEPGAKVYTINTLMCYRKPALEAWLTELQERKKRRENGNLQAHSGSTD